MIDEELITKFKLQSQLDHIFLFHGENDLKEIIYDLVLEWYVKGIQEGVKHEKKRANKELNP